MDHSDSRDVDVLGKGELSPETFQEIIFRKKQQLKKDAKRKRQEDLNRIREMNSNTGIDPLEQFPEEIWIRLLNELGPDDRGNACRVHGTLWRVSEKSMIRDVFFPKVLRLDEFFDKVYGDNGTRSIMEYLKLQMVSRKMRNSVKEYLENRILKALRQGGSHDLIYKLKIDILHESSRDVLNRMFKCFGVELLNKEEIVPYGHGVKAKHSRCKSITVKIGNSNCSSTLEETTQLFARMFNQMYYKFTKILEIIGADIWHFRFETYLEKDLWSLNGIYMTLHDWIQLMPNMKWLQVSIITTHSTFLYYHYKQMKEKKIPAELTISPDVRCNPFPHLAHLERIDFDLNSRIGETFLVFDRILQANSHVKIIKFDGRDCGQSYFDETMETQQHRDRADLIKSLPLEYFGAGQTWCANLYEIRPFMNYKWQLKCLELKLGNLEEMDENISMTYVFEFLEQFPTLEVVRLHVDPTNVWIRDDVKYLNLSNLIDFELVLQPNIDYQTNIHFFFSLQFLLYCAKLERLTWKLSLFSSHGGVGKLERHMIRHECHERIINFRAGIRNLKYSNVWEAFPTLKYVNVEIDQTGRTSKRLEKAINDYSREYHRWERDA